MTDQPLLTPQEAQRIAASLTPAQLEDGLPETIRGKWMLDGVVTLSEAAARLRAEATEFERLEREGWQLVEPVTDDWGQLVHRDPTRRLRETGPA